jgi:hypothetical protein
VQILLETLIHGCQHPELSKHDLPSDKLFRLSRRSRWWGDVEGRDAKQPVVALGNIDCCDPARLSPITPFYDHACVFAEHIHSFNRIEMIVRMPLFREPLCIRFFNRLLTVNRSVWSYLNRVLREQCCESSRVVPCAAGRSAARHLPMSGLRPSRSLYLGVRLRARPQREPRAAPPGSSASRSRA